MKLAAESDKWKKLYDTFDPLPEMKEEDSRPQMIKGSAATHREQAVPVTILLGEVDAPAFHP